MPQSTHLCLLAGSKSPFFTALVTAAIASFWFLTLPWRHKKQIFAKWWRFAISLPQDWQFDFIIQSLQTIQDELPLVAKFLLAVWFPIAKQHPYWCPIVWLTLLVSPLVELLVVLLTSSKYSLLDKKTTNTQLFCVGLTDSSRTLYNSPMPWTSRGLLRKCVMKEQILDCLAAIAIGAVFAILLAWRG